ncbi:hypothetical protein IFR05_014235 [Cadophora sp. M221]|nr:hypothetical protein IFR05_014235 [Cadophora sp. M221]
MAGSMGIGRVTGALTALYNENTAALINNSFDFTLVKLEAPAEFYGVGSTISRKRKDDAEDGRLHRTARRLGALFGEILPSTDDLFRAYGTRVSEICTIPSVNPQEGSSREGIFASHIGADTASIWAAVKSGSAAIAVHLLGCMLARVFTGPEAISVWVELVERQKEWTQKRQKTHLYSNEHLAAITAAQQDISRNDLASWDASARAWLQSADQAKAVHHKQTMLILNSMNLPVNSEPETYTSVIRAWTAALEAMNNLVRGLPQRVQDGATLLAISSWHLYPDMVVFGDCCKEIKQKDPLFEPAALLTLGLQHVRDDSKSVYWSLPLAHLQYYGHPIQAMRTVGQENSRISSKQFAYVILGCLFSGWQAYATTNGEGLEWVRRLAKILNLSTMSRFRHGSQPTWLIYVVIASEEFSDLEDSEITVANQLMNLGRRYSTFLHPPGLAPPPLFGMSQIKAFISILRDDQQRVECLRQLCTHLQLDGSNFLIKYRSSAKSAWTEYASVVPIKRLTQKRSSDGTLKSEIDFEKQTRWISLNAQQLLLLKRRGHDFQDLRSAIEKLENLNALDKVERLRTSSASGFGTSHSVKFSLEDPERLAYRRDLTEVIAMRQRQMEIEDRGEIFLPVIEYFQDQDQNYYSQSSRQFGTSLMFSKSLDFLQAASDLLVAREHPHAKRAATPQSFFMGDADKAALYAIKNNLQIPQGVDIIPGPGFLTDFFTPSKVDAEKIHRHFSSCIRSVEREISCLRACAMMSEVYHLLPGATISTLVVKLSLSNAKWYPPRPTTNMEQRENDDEPALVESLNLSQSFACIAMFESGTCNLDPGTLREAFAMASGNSLYVAGALLCDPHEQPSSTEIRRVIGNVGRAGITFLISPPEVKIRENNPEKWMTINHRDFDGQPENHFSQTSLHLSFTNYEIPLVTEDTDRHTIDRAVICVETLISIFEKGTWVGEVDVLKGLRSGVERAASDECSNTSCKSKGTTRSYHDMLLKAPQIAATSVENWDELIEAPCSGSIAVRAHENWLARLAATALCSKLQFQPFVLPKEVCWSCCAESIPKDGVKRLAFIF